MATMKKTFTVADTPVDVGWKKESASTHRKYPATKSQMTLFDRAWFMMTSRLQGVGITHAMGRTTQAKPTTDRLSDFYSAAAKGQPRVTWQATSAARVARHVRAREKSALICCSSASPRSPRMRRAITSRRKTERWSWITRTFSALGCAWTQ